MKKANKMLTCGIINSLDHGFCISALTVGRSQKNK